MTEAHVCDSCGNMEPGPPVGELVDDGEAYDLCSTCANNLGALARTPGNPAEHIEEPRREP